MLTLERLQARRLPPGPKETKPNLPFERRGRRKFCRFLLHGKHNASNRALIDTQTSLGCLTSAWKVALAWGISRRGYHGCQLAVIR